MATNLLPKNENHTPLTKLYVYYESIKKQRQNCRCFLYGFIGRHFLQYPHRLEEECLHYYHR